jgi:hypothetical protein
VTGAGAAGLGVAGGALLAVGTGFVLWSRRTARS